MKGYLKTIATITALAAFAAAASAQQPPKVFKIGVLVSSTPALYAARDAAFRQRLHELGHVEGKTVIIEYRYGEGKVERFPQLARQLVEQKVDVLVAGGTAMAVAAKDATTTIPIVVAGAGDLVEAGLVKSFMYPGGNVTGVARMSADFFGDRMKLTKQILPTTGRVAALYNPQNPGHGRSLKDAELGAQASGLTFQSVAARAPDELEHAIGAAAKGGAGVLFIMTDAMFNSQLTGIAQSAIKYRLPAIYDRTDFVEAGGLMSYGANLPELSRRAADYVDQILRGAKPGDLTLVQPIKFDLAVNLKTAQQIGVVIPQDVVKRAAKVIK